MHNSASRPLAVRRSIERQYAGWRRIYGMQSVRVRIPILEDWPENARRPSFGLLILSVPEFIARMGQC